MKKIGILFIRFYQKIISKYILVGKNCRFYPTCSEYAIEALEKYGFFKGTFLALGRIIRCNPFNRGGYDPLK